MSDFFFSEKETNDNITWGTPVLDRSQWSVALGCGSASKERLYKG